MVAAWELVDGSPPEAETLVGDKGYDSNELRAWLEDQGLTPVIPRRELDVYWGTEIGHRTVVVMLP